MVIQFRIITDHHPFAQVTGGTHGSCFQLNTTIKSGNGLILTIHHKSYMFPCRLGKAIPGMNIEVRIILSTPTMQTVVLIITNHKLKADFLVPVALGTE